MTSAGALGSLTLKTSDSEGGGGDFTEGASSVNAALAKGASSEVWHCPGWAQGVLTSQALPSVEMIMTQTKV